MNPTYKQTLSLILLIAAFLVCSLGGQIDGEDPIDPSHDELMQLVVDFFDQYLK